MTAAAGSETGDRPNRGRPRDAGIEGRVFAATADLLVEVGYADLSLAAIASRSGVARNTLYRRWSSVSEILGALLTQQMPATLEHTGDTRVDLENVIRNAIAQTSPIPIDAQIALMTASYVDPVIGASFEQFDLVHRGAVQTIVERAIAAGELRTDLDIEVFTDQIGGILSYRRLTHRSLPDHLATEAIRNLLEGARA